MYFNELLEIHRSENAEHKISGVLGDSYLLNHNPVYRRVREHALKMGVKFTEATTQYLLLPFNQLDRIVATKQVPYVPAAQLLEEVEAKHPKVFDLQQMPLPESYHLHEAAHVIADEACKRLALESQQDRVLKSILCESFANTADALACGYVDSEVHRTLLKLNCYMMPEMETCEQMKRVRAAHGEAFLARLVFLSYVCANFLREESPVLNESEDALALGEIGQRLDMLFRVQTTQNYFQLLGFEGEIYDLLDFDFMKLLERPDFADAVDAMLDSLQP